MMKSVIGALVIVCSFSAQAAFDRVELNDMGYLNAREVENFLSKKGSQIHSAMDCSNMAKIAETSAEPAQLTAVPWALIINIGRSIWAVIEQGQPLIQEKYNVATALPAGTKCWTELSKWSRPVMKRFQYKFFAGTSYTKMDLVVVAVTGGSKAGKGKYIAYSSAFAESIKNWGIMNKLSVNVEVPAVYNEGDDTDPVGAMLMTVKVGNDSPLVDRIDGKAILVSGKGVIELTDDGSKN